MANGMANHPGAAPGVMESLQPSGPVPGVDTSSGNSLRTETAKLVHYLGCKEILRRYEWAIEEFSKGKGCYYTTFYGSGGHDDNPRGLVGHSIESIEQYVAEKGCFCSTIITRERLEREYAELKAKIEP